MKFKEKRKNIITSTIDFLYNNAMVVIVVFIIIAGIASTFYIFQNSENIEKNQDSTVNFVKSDTVYLPMLSHNDFNILTTTDNDVFYMWPMLYSSLFKFDSKLNVTEDLVSKFDTNAEEGTVNINLRQAKFSDGKKLDSKAVRNTVEIIKSIGEKSPFYTYVSKIQRIDIISDTSFNIIFHDPSDASLSNLVFPITGTYSKETETSDMLMGSGPYKLDSLDIGNGIRLTPNENFYGDKAKSKVEFKFISDAKAVEGLLKMGSITSYVDITSVTDIESSDKILSYKKIPSADVEFIGFNFDNSLLKNKYIRHAIAKGIDTNTLIEDFMGGRAKSVSTIYFPNYLGVSNKDAISYEPTQSTVLLRKHGYELNEKTKLLENKNGENIKLSLLVNSNNKSRVDMANIINGNLKKIGIEVDVEAVSEDEYFSRLKDGKYDFYIGGMHMDPRFDLRKLFDKSSGIRYSNTDVVNQISNMETCITSADRKKIFEEVHKSLVEDIPVYPIGYKTIPYVAGKHLNGEKDFNYFTIYDNVYQYVWEKPEGVSKDK